MGNVIKIVLACFFAILTNRFLVRRKYDSLWKKVDSELEKKVNDRKSLKIYQRLLDDNKNYIKRTELRCPTASHFLGQVEQPLYILAIVSGNYYFIVAWLAFKVVGIWRVWEKSRDRASYNMFTIGNALSLLNAVIWSFVFFHDKLLK